MKKLFLTFALYTFALSAMKNETNSTELHTISHPFLQEELNDIRIVQRLAPLPVERKEPTKDGWSLAKKIFIGSLLASQGISLATDIIGMQESQKLSNISSPIAAYNVPDYWSSPHPANCSVVEETGLLYPLPAYIRNVNCNCGPDNCDECIIETCPHANQYVDNFSTMYASQITAIGTRALTMLGILIGAFGCYNR